jgi:hypothetical protein
VRSLADAPSFVAAIATSASRAVAHACARFSWLKFTGWHWLPDDVPWSGVIAVSHSTRRMRLIGTESSSAASWYWTV